MIDLDWQTYLTSLVPCPVEQNFVSEDKLPPWVWWQRKSSTTDILLSGATALVETNYAVEVVGLDADATAAIADTLTRSIHGFFGAVGGSNVLGAFVSDADDDYIPRSFNLDEGFHVFAFQVQLLS